MEQLERAREILNRGARENMTEDEWLGAESLSLFAIATFLQEAITLMKEQNTTDPVQVGRHVVYQEYALGNISAPEAKERLEAIENGFLNVSLPTP